jgi:Lon protease-like protein
MKPSLLLSGRVEGELAVFPLPEVTLFPGALMPLHIFEPRYRAMVADALDGNALLVIAQIPDDARRTPDGNPAFSELATVGRIVKHERLQDGRFNILVLGLARVRVTEVASENSYRKVVAEVVRTAPGAPDEAEVTALSMTAQSFAERMRAVDPSFEFESGGVGDAGWLADQCAHYLVLDGAERQRLLEHLNDGERVSACLEVLMRQAANLGHHDTLH